MNVMKVLIGVLAFLLIFLLAIAGFLLFFSFEEPIPEKSPPVFSVLETGVAGSFAYTVYDYRGNGSITLVSCKSKPLNKITIINDPNALEATKFTDFVDDIKRLEAYGYTISVSDQQKVSDGIYIVPTGAIPSYVLFNLQEDSSNATIIYIGEKNLLLSSGIKQDLWYDSLLDNQKERIVHYSGTLDEFVESGNSLFYDILYEKWNRVSDVSTTNFSGAENGLRTSSIKYSDGNYLRIVYALDDLYGIYDSEPLPFVDQFLVSEPESKFSWERSTLWFTLNRTNGTAVLSVKKDGKVVEQKTLRRVTDSNIFQERLEYKEPGEYILEVSDNKEVIASGLLHVKDLNIKFVERNGYSYIFSVNVDGIPLKNAEAFVSVDGSDMKNHFYISDGTLVVGADIGQGMHTFNVDILDSTINIDVYNEQDQLFDFYLKYGLPGVALILIVYFAARISRKPTYRLRFGDAGTYIRQEMRLPLESAIIAFRRIREDMVLGTSPITGHEFSIALKRYLTNGAEVTEGNIEEILKQLTDAKRLETHRDYYQMKGEGDVKTNVLRRMIREKLIENGTMFTEKKNKFITEDYEIGFFGEAFSKKGIIVFDSDLEKKRAIADMDDKERVKLKIMQSNGIINMVTIDGLEDVL